ncbi:hypothetical protein F503_02295 [Ophiostoma piceae UAMH 11346]|uniref:Uncharacterized protein n=1 Tax=Ophiostoma piceae (strain UAMH 11346) TaxID=1262450 RepID=S3C1F8_OPHP1|nr:hypothetical protein F503_02295 [Ophiostoma piceae UAMH 11346]
MPITAYLMAKVSMLSNLSLILLASFILPKTTLSPAIFRPQSSCLIRRLKLLRREWTLCLLHNRPRPNSQYPPSYIGMPANTTGITIRQPEERK